MESCANLRHSDHVFAARRSLRDAEVEVSVLRRVREGVEARAAGRVLRHLHERHRVRELVVRQPRHCAPCQRQAVPRKILTPAEDALVIDTFERVRLPTNPSIETL